MSRPSLLVRAAHYAANATLRRAPLKRTSAEGPLCEKLMEEETRLNEARRSGDAAYSPTRHVEVLTKLLVVAQQTPRSV